MASVLGSPEIAISHAEDKMITSLHAKCYLKCINKYTPSLYVVRLQWAPGQMAVVNNKLIIQSALQPFCPKWFQCFNKQQENSPAVPVWMDGCTGVIMAYGEEKYECEGQC